MTEFPHILTNKCNYNCRSPLADVGLVDVDQWPPRSSALSPEFIMVFIKDLIYETSVSSLENFVGKIVEIAGYVRDIPDMFEKMHQSMQSICSV